MNMEDIMIGGTIVLHFVAVIVLKFGWWDQWFGTDHGCVWARVFAPLGLVHWFSETLETGNAAIVHRTTWRSTTLQLTTFVQIPNIIYRSLMDTKFPFCSR